MTNDQPLAVLTVGLPACGKTTWANSDAARAVLGGDFANVNLDDCRALVPGSLGAHDQTVTAAAVHLHNVWVDAAIHDRRNLLVSDTNLNPFHRDALVAKLQNAGFRVLCAVFLTPFKACADRNAQRAHPVPDHAMDRMSQAFFDQGWWHIGDLAADGNGWDLAMAGTPAFVPAASPVVA